MKSILFQAFLVLFLMMTSCLRCAAAQDLCPGNQHLQMTGLDMPQGVTLSHTSAYSAMLPAGNYIFPNIRFASCNGNISKVFFFTAPVDKDSMLELNISIWRPTESKYEKVSEYIIEQALPQDVDLEGSEDYEQISVNISVPMPVYRGDILGLSLPSPESQETAISVLAYYNASTNVGLTEESVSCWNIDEGEVSDCHVLALAAHPVIAVYLTDYEDVLPTPQMPPLLDTEQGMTSNDMLLAAVVVLASILLLAFLAIASLVAFILWKSRKPRDRSDGKLAQQIFTRTAVEAGNTSCTNVETNYEELEYCQNGSCRPSTGKNSTVDTNQLAIMTNEDHKEHKSLIKEAQLVYENVSSANLMSTIMEEKMYENGSAAKLLHESFSTVGEPLIAQDSAYAVLEQVESDEDYWDPGDSEYEIYQQIASNKFNQIDVDAVHLEDLLGKGQFGEVYKGWWSNGECMVEVAVKQPKQDGSDSNAKIKLLQEAAILGQFKHPRVTKVYGIVMQSDPVMMIMEYLHNGDLCRHLNDIGENSPKDPGLPKKLLQFCLEIADGMSYLSKKGFIHRDLAARNILLDKEWHCKINDFGMSRNLDDSIYYTTQGGRIPLRWTAPEAIFFMKYTTKSDVWSYGMVMYEIWSLGHKPFEETASEEILTLHSTGYCLPPPPHVPRGVYSLMVDCWNPSHYDRPSFSSLFAQLQASEVTPVSTPLESKPEGEEASRWKDLQMKYLSAQQY